MTIDCPIARYAAEMPDQAALVAPKKILSYKELHHRICQAGEHIKNRGIAKGAMVALVGRSSIELIVLLAALWRSSANALLLNHRFPQASINDISQRTSAKRIDIREIPGAGETYRAEKHASHRIDLDAEATVIMTSGSTGVGKAVVHRYGNHYYNALGSNENIALEPGDRWLLSLPLFHVGGLGILFRCFLAGAAMIIPGDNETIGDAIASYRVTHVSMVSTQLQRLLQEIVEPRRTPRDTKENRFSSLKALLLGGSAFPQPLIRQALDTGLPVYTTYGLSEMASQVTATPPNAPQEKLFTSGKVLNYRCLHIDETGEICVCGETLFSGYLEKGNLSLPLDRQSRFHTGDLGRIDDEGYLHVLGRKDNMFISGGENIMPEEIEHRLTQLPVIQQAVVVPLADKTYGVRPAAFLKPAPNTTISREAVLDYLQTHLPRFKVPDLFYEWPPEDPGSMKVQRPFFHDLLNHPETLTLLFRK